MSRVIRKIKVGNQNTIKELLEDEKKRIRLYFLVSGVLLVALGVLLSKPQVKKSVQTEISKKDQEVSSFSLEPVKIDKSLLGINIEKSKAKSPPIRILLSDIKIDLPVKEAKVINGFWEVFPDSAAFGLGSAYPEDVTGNQVIFAHAREGLFLPLRKAKVGQNVTVFTKDKWYLYKITQIEEVTPDKKEVIAPTKNAILTLYTCTGFSDSKRLIVIAEKV